MDWRHVAMARELLKGESGAVISDWGGKVPIALAYPNSYAVGMSSLAMHGLYTWFNALPGVVCERAFASLGQQFPAEMPPFTLETQQPLQDVALLAFSVSFELDYFNLLNMLRRSGIPLLAEERHIGQPLVVLGGPAVSANPEPLAPVADAIVIGEAETLLGSLVDVVRGTWGNDRRATLEQLAHLPGVYVPLLYHGEGVQRQWLRDLDAYPLASTIVAPQAEFGDMHLIEISRGCGRGCRFCLAGYWYRPPRERSLGIILKQAREGLQHRNKIGLVAAAVSDYSAIDELVCGLRQMGAAISVSSLRVAPLSPVLLRALAESGSRTITFAPEAGSERLRRVVNKCITHEDIIAATSLAAMERFEVLKLYFMLGLPHETDTDIGELIRLAIEIKAAFPRQVVVNLTPFVPKAHTPFQRVSMAPQALLDERLKRIRVELRRAHIEVRAESVDTARVQGMLARGDRRLGMAMVGMSRLSPARLERALMEQGLAIENYLGEKATDQELPWDFVASAVTSRTLATELERSLEECTTDPCAPAECRRCGVCLPEERAL
jgi:radical SAM superfamily enzyme YgiQ (UPF0313 family)